MKNQIMQRLKEWREERGLTIEGQKEGLEKNFNEEYKELQEAILKDDKLGVIDAFCDICVLLINTGEELQEFKPLNRFGFYTARPSIEWIKNSFDAKRWGYVFFFCFSGIYSLGYDPFLCMLETIKELESRTGAWDDEKNKWVKDISEEAKKRWYKANYEVCKRVE